MKGQYFSTVIITGDARNNYNVAHEWVLRDVQQRAKQLIWLNPLLGSPDYQPLTRGMQAALPHLDRFLPAHNLASLEQLAEILTSGLKVSMPVRQTVQI